MLLDPNFVERLEKMMRLSWGLAAFLLWSTGAHAEDCAHYVGRKVAPVSAQSEPVRRLTERSYEVVKPAGRVIVEAGSPLRIQELARARAFNLVPGFQAVPFVVDGSDAGVVTFSLRVGA